MNKKGLLGTLLAITTVFSPLSYGMERSIISEESVNGKLTSATIGIVSRYLSLKDREKLRCVNTKTTLGVDDKSGYVDRYFELYEMISKLPKCDVGYKIDRDIIFFKIYRLLKETDFRVLCIEPSNPKIFQMSEELQKFFLETSINLYTYIRGNRECFYIILPRSYKPSYMFKLNEDQQKHIKLLQQIEKTFDDELCSKLLFNNLSIWKLFRTSYYCIVEDEEIINASKDFHRLKMRSSSSYEMFGDNDIIKKSKSNIRSLISSNKITKDYEYIDSEGIERCFKNDGCYKHPIYQLFFNQLDSGVDVLAGQTHKTFRENFNIAVNNMDVITINMVKYKISDDLYALANEINNFSYNISDILKNLNNEKTGLDFAKNLLYVYDFVKRDDDTIKKLLNLIEKKYPIIYEKTFGKIPNLQVK